MIRLIRQLKIVICVMVAVVMLGGSCVYSIAADGSCSCFPSAFSSFTDLSGTQESMSYISRIGRAINMSTVDICEVNLGFSNFSSSRGTLSVSYDFACDSVESFKAKYLVGSSYVTVDLGKNTSGTFNVPINDVSTMTVKFELVTTQPSTVTALISGYSFAEAPPIITSADMLPTIEAITPQISVDTVVVAIAGFVLAAMAIVFVWWAVRKAVSVLLTAFRNGKFKT